MTQPAPTNENRREYRYAKVRTRLQIDQLLATAAGLGDKVERWFNKDERAQLLSRIARTVTRGATSSGPDTRLKRENLVADFLAMHQDNPAAVTVREVATATRIPPATIGRMAVWAEFVAYRESRASAPVRSIPLTERMIASIPDRMASDPAEEAAERELFRLAEIARLTAEQMKDAERDGW